jgi:hypothetical protein
MTTWDDLMEVAQTDDDVYPRMDALEGELSDDGTIRPLTSTTTPLAWERYWQTIADTYVARYGDPTGKGTK